MSNKVVIDLDKLVKPRTLIDESRAKELVAGMIRLSADEDTEIPTEWIEEYREIAERYPVLKLEESTDDEDTENPDDSGNSDDSGESGNTDDSGNTDGSDNTDNTDDGGNNG